MRVEQKVQELTPLERIHDFRRQGRVKIVADDHPSKRARWLAGLILRRQRHQARKGLPALGDDDLLATGRPIDQL
jgi:hypothetical protein